MQKIVLVLLGGLLSGTVFSIPTSYWQTYGPAPIVSGLSLYGNLNKTLELSSVEETGEFLVVVTSKKRLKIEAAKKFFKKNKRFAKAKLEFVGVGADSNIAPQPLGLKNALRGAKNRIKNARTMYENPNNKPVYFCSIENFFTKPDVYKPRDHAAVIIETPLGQQFRYVSDGIEVDPEIYDQALDQKGLAQDGTGALKTVGEVLGELYGLDSSNWQQFVTQAKVSRIDQIVSAYNSDVPF